MAEAKRVKAWKSKLTPGKQYPIDEALKLIKEFATAKFNESVDAAVASLVLCSVPDQDRALAELRRVLRPGGELRFYEHVVALSQPKRLLLQAADRSTLWPRIAGGCHPARDTGAAIARAGFDIQRSERFNFRSARFEPAIPHILGIAIKPGYRSPPESASR